MINISPFLLAIFGLFLVNPSCTSSPSMPVHKIVFDISIPQAQQDPLPMSYQFQRANVPASVEIYWNEQQSLLQETGTNYGTMGYQAEKRTAGSTEVTFYKDFHILRGTWKAEESLDADSEYNPPKLDLTGQRKEVLGYPCEELILTQGGQRNRLWFSRELPPLPKPLPQFDLQNVPGLVLEIEELDSDGKWTKRMSATEFTRDLQSLPDLWQGNADFVSYPTLTALRDALQETLRAKREQFLPEESLGTFSMKTTEGEYQLSIEQTLDRAPGNAPYEVDRFVRSSPSQKPDKAPAWPYGQDLYLENPPNWDRLRWNPQDKSWQNADYPFLVYR